MDKAFEEWFTNVIRKWEGGSAERDPKDDPGGFTRHGVTIGHWISNGAKIIGKPPTKEALNTITWDDAKKIAYVDFWVKKKINTIANSSFRPIVADTYWLGGGISSLGYPSIAALNKNKLETVSGLFNKRMNYLKSLKNWDANKNGWANRMNSVIESAKKFGGNNKIMIAGVIIGSAALAYGFYELNKTEKWLQL